MKKGTRKEKLMKDSRESQEARYLRVSRGPKFRAVIMRDRKKEANKKRCRSANADI